MKSLLLNIFFVSVVIQNLKAQPIKCNIQILGKYRISEKNDTLGVVLLQSENCEKKNIAIFENSKNQKGGLTYTESSYYSDCMTKIDTIVWLFYYTNKYKFDTTRIRTSKPYSNKSKKDKQYFFHSDFIIINDKWVVDFTMQNDKVIYFKVFNESESIGNSLTELGNLKLLN